MADKPEGPGPSKPVDPKAAEELRKSMQATKDAASAVTASFEQQLKVILQLRDAMASISSNLEKMGDQGGTGLLSPEKWEEVNKQVEKNKTETKGATTAIKKMADVMQSKWTKAALVAQGALTGLYQGFKNLAAITKSVVGFFGSIAGGAFSVSKAILAIPFKMLGGLIKMAQSGGGGNELAQAYENVREQFGSLQSESSRTVIDVAKNMDAQNQTGVSAYRIFGNLAERIEAVNKLAGAMGNTFQVFQKEIQENGTAIMMYQRGLGLTDEQMQSIAQTAMRMGKGVAQVQNEMTKQALGMSKAFGVNAKVLSKDMGKAMQDLAHFGHLSTKEMAVAATFAQKLGVSVDKLTAIMDSTATFDQAAEGMSKLNQQFGTNIDATQIMMAQNPAEKVEMLRKEFAKTGKDMSKMSYQERMLIKQSTGLDDAMMDAAFSAKNAGVSLDKISKQGDKNEAKTMSQAEAMHELADSIKRLTPSGGGGGGGVLDHILDGISRGIQSSPEFIGLMQNINRVMMQATQFGVKLGRMFVDLFPGVKDVFGGLRDMLNPARFQKMFDGVLKAFDVFKDGGTGKMEDFMDQIQKVFMQFFDEGEPGGKKVLEGFKKFGEAVVKIFGMMSKWIIDKLSGIIVSITDWLKNPKLPDVSGATEGLGGAIAGPFEGALSSLKEKLWPAFKGLVEQLWEMLKKAITDMSPEAKMIIGGALATIVFGPAILGAVTGLASSGIFGKAGKQLSEGLAGAAAGASKDAAGAAQGAAAAMPDVSKSPAAMATSAIPDEKTIGQMEAASKSKVDWSGLTKFLLGIAGMFTIGMVAFSKAIDMVKGVDIADIGKATLLFGSVATFMIPMAKAGEILTNAKSMDWKALGQVLLSISGMMLIGIAGFSLGILAVKKLNVSMKDIGLAETFMLAMIPPMIAAGILVAETYAIGKLVSGAAKELGIGALAMGVAIGAMVGVAYAIGSITKKIGANEMQAGANMMDVMANTFMKAGVVILEATAIGAGIIASAGLGAAAAAAGLAAMTAAVAVMAESAGTILVHISSIPGDPNALKLKTEAFTLVMDSVGRMMGQISGILKALDFGFFESESSKIEKIGAAKDLVQSLLNGDDGKGGINGVINTIVKGLETLTPDKLETTKAFASVLNAVSGMMTAAAKGAEGLQSNAIGWFTTAAEDQETIKASMDGAGGYISTVMKSSEGLMKAIIDSLKSVEDPAKFKEAGGALGSILQAITGLMTAIAPSVKDFHKSSETSVSASAGILGPSVSATDKSAGVDAAGIASAAAYMSTVMGAISEHIPKMINSIMSGVGSELSKLDKSKLDALPAVGELLKAVGGIVASISVGSKGIGNVNISAAQGATVAIINQIPDVSKIMEDIGKSAPQLLKNLIELTKLIPKGSDFKEKVGVISTMFDAVNKIVQSVNSAIDGSKVTQVPGAGTINSILISLHDVEVMLWGFRYNWTDKGNQTVKIIIEHLKALAAIVNEDPKFGEKSKAIVDLFENVNKIVTAVSTPFKEAPKDNTVNAILTNMTQVGEILKGLAEGKDGKGSPIQLIKDGSTKLNEKLAGNTVGSTEKMMKSFTDSVNNIMSAINIVVPGKEGITKSWGTVVDILDSIMGRDSKSGDLGKVVTHMRTLGEVAFHIKMNGLAQNIKAVQDMVAKTRDLDVAVNDLGKTSFKFPAKLEALAAGMGLGGKFAYTVQSKDVVINMHIDISMDVDRVEKVLITRHNSIIRDRINFGLENSSVKDKSSAYIKATGDQGTPVAKYNQ